MQNERLRKIILFTKDVTKKLILIVLLGPELNRITSGGVC